jgi:hypothetical protein
LEGFLGLRLGSIRVIRRTYILIELMWPGSYS